jgi:prolipoprotein diacylglyceryltransferase
MRDLWVHGGGLPMNAAPPPRYVERGIYRLLPHPIYSGFCLVCAGVSIAVGSASGLWLVSPVVAMGCTALVLGYERHDLQERFGRESRRLLPAESLLPPATFDRLACYGFVLLPWAGVYGLLHLLGRPFHFRSAFILTGNGGLVIHAAMAICASAYIGFAIAPLIAHTRSDLRLLCVRSLAAMAIAFALFLFIPMILNLDVVPSSSVLWELAGPNPAMGSGWQYFPSMPVLFALLFAQALEQRWPWTRWIAGLWAILITTGSLLLTFLGSTLFQREFVPVLGALVSFVLATYLPQVWQAIRAIAEHIANSWQEWRIGPIRVINHGAYAGLAAFLAIWISAVLAGPGHLTAILFASTAAVVGAALWAQYVEGSPQLLRPYGFYGGLLGGTLGALAAPLFHTSVWLLLGVFSASGSLVQAAGRLRCLVQGCCHGKPAPAEIGIRYVHPRSRVCRLSPWTDVPLHPTPVYSILWNCAVTLLLFRLWSAHASLQLIVGLYFMLSGLGRFVEESWRGEPQTKVVAGLRLYQWAAVASLVLGALFTCFNNGELAPDPSFRWSALLPAIAFALVAFCAMGVDFPDSQRRFSRLT